MTPGFHVVSQRAAQQQGVVLSPATADTPFTVSFAKQPNAADGVDERYKLHFVLSGAVAVAAPTGETFVAKAGDSLLSTPSSTLNVQNEASSDGSEATLLTFSFPDHPSSRPENLQWLKRSLSEIDTYQLPNQTNRLALIFDPFAQGVPLTFGMEIFEPGHETPPHVHTAAHEVFFVLAGNGAAFCDDERRKITPGDTVVLPPKSVHGIDNDGEERLYCLEMMFPNQQFAELVMSGERVGKLTEEDKKIIGACA